jgi:hypothetical protein
MTYTLTVSAEHPQELADLLTALVGGESSKTVKQAASKKAVVPTKEDDKEEESETVTKEMVRELTAEKVQKGKTDKVKKLLAKYNAKNAATVPEESFADYYNELKSI